MKKATWGWYPPQYEQYKNGKYRIFYNPQRIERTQEGKNNIIEYEVWYEELELPELTEAIKNKNELLIYKIVLLEKIKAYDCSSFVNSFTVNDLPIWIDKSSRASLKLRFDLEKASGKEKTTLWYEGMSFPLELDKAIYMLNSVELYAALCYDITQQHLANVNKLENIEEIKNYNYTLGYPNKLEFVL